MRPGTQSGEALNFGQIQEFYHRALFLGVFGWLDLGTEMVILGLNWGDLRWDEKIVFSKK